MSLASFAWCLNPEQAQASPLRKVSAGSLVAFAAARVCVGCMSMQTWSFNRYCISVCVFHPLCLSACTHRAAVWLHALTRFTLIDESHIGNDINLGKCTMLVNNPAFGYCHILLFHLQNLIRCCLGQGGLKHSCFGAGSKKWWNRQSANS